MLTSKQLEELRAAVQQESLRDEVDRSSKDDNQKSNLAKWYGFKSWLDFAEAVQVDAKFQLALQQDSIVFHDALEAIFEGFGRETAPDILPDVVLDTGRPRASTSPSESFTPMMEAHWRANRKAISEVMIRLHDLRMLQHYFGIAEPDGGPSSTPKGRVNLDVLHAAVLEQESARKVKEVEPIQVIVSQAGEIKVWRGQGKEPGGEK